MTPIYTIRAWKVRYTNPQRLLPLANTTYIECWDGPVVVSPNGVDTGKAGFWGLRGGVQVIADQLSGYTCSAIGAIEPFGDVMEYEMGYRSDLAVVRYVTLLKNAFDNLYPAGVNISQVQEALAQLYACDVEIVPDFQVGLANSIKWRVTQLRPAPSIL